MKNRKTLICLIIGITIISSSYGTIKSQVQAQKIEATEKAASAAQNSTTATQTVTTESPDKGQVIDLTSQEGYRTVSNYYQRIVEAYKNLAKTKGTTAFDLENKFKQLIDQATSQYESYRISYMQYQKSKEDSTKNTLITSGKELVNTINQYTALTEATHPSPAPTPITASENSTPKAPLSS